MRKISMFLIALMLLLSTTVFGQLTGTKNIPGDYATLSLAIADLNTQGVGSGGVTFNVAAGHTETFATPTAGLITATGTSANPIIFQKSGAGVNPLITAGTGTSTTVDGIIVIKGGDFITFDGIDLMENSANTTATMQMEWGYAIVKASTTDGAKNINISNCGITLNKTNTATIGIYANNHTDANTTNLTIADVSGTNQNIKINGCTITNSYGGIYVKGSTTLAYYDTNLEIGSTTGNIISNFGGGSSTVSGIYITGQTAPKIEKNNITLGTGTTTTAYGINVASACIGNLTINLNTVSVSSSATSSLLAAINSAAPSITNVNITNNTVENCSYLTATTGSFYGIYEQGATTGSTVNITGNTVKNSSLGSLTTAGSGTFYGVYATSGSPLAVNVNSNTINGNINSGTTGGTIYGIYINKGTTQTANTNNIFDNSIVGTGTSGTFYGIRTVTGTVIHNFNNIYNNSVAKATATSGTIYGIYNLASPTNETYNSNAIYNLTSLGTTAVNGINANTTSGTRTVASNEIYGLSTNGSINGLSIAASNSSVYKNKIYNLSGNGASSAINGIYVSSGTTNTIYNNFISDLKAPIASSATAIAGIFVSGGTNANLFYNTIYLNATSTGALFGSAGIYASTSPIVDMRNNIIVNTSTPMGTLGYTAAYRRSGVSLTTYSANSNNNCFYAGIPGANNVIYYDGPTAAVNFVDIAAIFGARDNVSFSVVPPFVNVATAPYDLKLQAGVATMCESGGQRITTPAITDDYEGTLRFGEVGYTDGGTGTDVGADEFVGIAVYTCATPTPGNTIASANALCLGASTVLSMQNATPGTGVSYQWKSSADGITYTNGPTTATWNTVPTAVTFYQCEVTCLNGPVSGTSAPVQVTFNQTTPTVTPGTRCGTGDVVLAATGTGTLNWYAAPTGGASLFTGSPYTANLSATTTYYVGAESASAATVTLGAGASTSAGYETPFNHIYGGIKSQYLVKASELTSAGLSAGNITALSFNIAVAGTSYSSFNLSIGSTALTALTTTIQTGLSSVYSIPSITPTAGIYTITFATPYLWDGTSNIIVETCWSNNNGGGASTTVKYDNPGFVSTSYFRADSQAPAVLCATTTATGTLSNRPQMIFAGQGACSSPRVPVTATVTTAPEFTVSADKTVCNDAIVAISVTSPLANYDTYVWTPAAGLFTDAAATIAYVAGASATSVYAKTATAGTTNYVCLGSNVALCAKTDTVAITVLPATPTITAVSSPICVSGTSALNVVPATGYGAATFQWNISTDNVSFAPISGHTTLNDVTDVLTATTYYKLVIKDDAGNVCLQPTVSVIVNNPLILSTTPATRCGIGTVTLGSTVSAGSTSKWYATAISPLVLATGTSFTTPVISTTTDYYVAAETANSTITVGSGSTSSSGTYTPFSGSYGGIKTQQLFTAAELQAAGLTAGPINNMALEVTVAGTTYNGFSIQMGNTSLNDFTSTVNIQGGLTTVYSAPSSAPIVGTNAYSFSTPYVWDGTSNVIVSICWSNVNASNSSATVKVDPTSNYSSQSYRADNQTAAFLLAFTGSTTVTGTLTSSMNRPVMKFNYQPSCASGRVLVTATVTPAPVLTLSAVQTVCNNAVATISVTSTLADYNAYVWTPATNLFTDAAATVPYVAGASATTIYLKTITAGANVITCSASNAALCANVATTTVNVNLAPDVTILASSNAICAGSSVTLDAIFNYTPTNPVYATPSGASSAGDEDLGNVTFGSLNNTTAISSLVGTIGTATGTASKYSDFTSFGPYNVEVGNTYPLSVTTLTSGSPYSNAIGVYIDYNRNGVFTDPGEAVYVSAATTSGPHTETANITIPSTAKAGVVRMRVISNEGFVTGPNMSITFGEVEEYSLNIITGTSASYSWSNGASVVGTTSSITDMPAATTTYTLTVVEPNTCSTTITPVTVSVNPVLIALNSVNVTCNGGNDGSFTEGAITCGTAPFTFSIDGGAYGAIPTNLIAGPHTVIVKDAALNLSAPISLVLTQPAAIEIPTVGTPVVACQGVSSAVVSATTSIGVETATIVVPFDVLSQPVEVNATPGSIVATATMPAIPVGSTITNVTLSYPGTLSIGGSWQSEIKFGFSGAVINTELGGTGAAFASGLYDYTNIFAAPTINFAGGPVNLLYWNSSDDVSGGADATFPVGMGVATLSITYNVPATITWYDAATGGAVLGTGNTLETVGTTVLPNTNTPGTYNFYAEGSHATCVSATRALTTVTISAPSIGGIAIGTLNTVCSGTGTSIILTGNTGNIQWQSSTDGTTWNNVAGETTATLATGNLTAKTYYQAVVTSGVCASAVSSIDSVEVIALPVAGTLAGGATVCADANSTLLTLTGSVGTILRWESSLDGTTWAPVANTTDTYTATNLTATTHYRAVVDNGVCSNNSNEVIITVTPLPTATITYANSPFCSSSVAETVTFVGTTGGVYSATTGLTIDASTGAINPSASTAGSYLVTYTIAAAGGCGVVSDDVTIDITTAPTANITYVGSPFINDVTTPQAVTLVGTTGGVYSSTTGLTLNASTGAIIPSTSTVGTYVVTYTIAAAGGCGIVTDTANVVINAPATCETPTALVVSAINAAGATLNWTNGGAETAWNIRYKKTADATYTNVTNTTTKPYILTTLQANSAYVWNVQAVCSSTLSSTWSIDNTFTTTVGIESNSLSGLTVYSFDSQINVTNNGNVLVKAVVIYDMIGQEVGTYAINSTDNILVNTNLVVGTYMVKVITADKVGTYKLFIK